jgi:hypothetical protein
MANQAGTRGQVRAQIADFFAFGRAGFASGAVRRIFTELKELGKSLARAFINSLSPGFYGGLDI